MAEVKHPCCDTNYSEDCKHHHVVLLISTDSVYFLLFSTYLANGLIFFAAFAGNKTNFTMLVRLQGPAVFQIGGVGHYEGAGGEVDNGGGPLPIICH